MHGWVFLLASRHGVAFQTDDGVKIPPVVLEAGTAEVLAAGISAHVREHLHMVVVVNIDGGLDGGSLYEPLSHWTGGFTINPIRI